MLNIGIKVFLVLNSYLQYVDKFKPIHFLSLELKQILVMKSLKLILLYISLIILFSMCKNSSDHLSDASIDLDVSWETTYDSIRGISTATFTFINKNNSEILDSNWTLYYNQAPRKLVNDDVVKHINGDYYALKAPRGFKLLPSDSATFSYSFHGALIKKTDAPRGVFMVLKTKDNCEHINPLSDFEIKDLNKQGYAYNDNYKWQPAIEDVTLALTQKIIPTPFNIEDGLGEVMINNSWSIVAGDKLEFEKEYLQNSIEKLTGLKLNFGSESNNQTIYFNISEGSHEDDEAYSMDIQHNKVLIESGSKEGVFYGIQSLLSLIGVVDGNRPENVTLKCMNIKDKPRFKYRGLHLDVCRNFHSMEEVKKVIDLMARYKLNKLHLCLSEDEGWRIEIKALPELTEVGATRAYSQTELDCLNPAYGSGPYSNIAGNYGSGYYSQTEFIDILKYAQSRHVEVIPSINVPGHARAAIKSMEKRYSHFVEEGDPLKANEYRLISPHDTSNYLSAQFYNDNVVDVSLESVYRFYETVIDEILLMYNQAGVELKTVHTGGDEVPEGAWSGNRTCLKLADNLGVYDVKNLQAYFFQRINTMLQKKGLKVAGWEEIALRKANIGAYEINTDFASENVLPFVWNNLWGNDDLGNKLANEGYPVILCSASNLYFDLAYDDSPEEPGLYWAGYVNEFSPWVYEPLNLVEKGSDMENLMPGKEVNILGIQGQLWSETIEGSEMLEYYLLPKLFGLAERAWAKQPEWSRIENVPEKESETSIEWTLFSNVFTKYDLPSIQKLYGPTNYRVAPPLYFIENDTLYMHPQYFSQDLYYMLEDNEYRYNYPVSVSKGMKVFTVDLLGNKSRVIEIRSCN